MPSSPTWDDGNSNFAVGCVLFHLMSLEWLRNPGMLMTQARKVYTGPSVIRKATADGELSNSVEREAW